MLTDYGGSNTNCNYKSLESLLVYLLGIPHLALYYQLPLA